MTGTMEMPATLDEEVVEDEGDRLIDCVEGTEGTGELDEVVGKPIEM
jgi:hypothetical protein